MRLKQVAKVSILMEENQKNVKFCSEDGYICMQVYSLMLYSSVTCLGGKRANKFAGIEIELLNVRFISFQLIWTCEIDLKPQRRLFDFEPESISSPAPNAANRFIEGTSIRSRLKDLTSLSQSNISDERKKVYFSIFRPGTSHQLHLCFSQLLEQVISFLL